MVAQCWRGKGREVYKIRKKTQFFLNTLFFSMKPGSIMYDNIEDKIAYSRSTAPEDENHAAGVTDKMN